MKQRAIQPLFVEFIPEAPSDGVLYISRQYQTAVHRCCCGCGQEVVTPLTPTDWKLTVNGDKVSLNPSIGNWSIACRSHYWIRQNQVIWAGDMTQRQIDLGRAHDRATKAAYYGKKKGFFGWLGAIWRWMTGGGN